MYFYLALSPPLHTHFASATSSFDFVFPLPLIVTSQQETLSFLPRAHLSPSFPFAPNFESTQLVFFLPPRVRKPLKLSLLSSVIASCPTSCAARCEACSRGEKLKICKSLACVLQTLLNPFEDFASLYFVHVLCPILASFDLLPSGQSLWLVLFPLPLRLQHRLPRSIIPGSAPCGQYGMHDQQNGDGCPLLSPVSPATRFSSRHLRLLHLDSSHRCVDLYLLEHLATQHPPRRYPRNLRRTPQMLRSASGHSKVVQQTPPRVLEQGNASLILGPVGCSEHQVS